MIKHIVLSANVHGSVFVLISFKKKCVYMPVITYDCCPFFLQINEDLTKMNYWTILKVMAMVGLASEVIYYTSKKKVIRKLVNVVKKACCSSLDHPQVIQQLQQEYFYKVLFFPDEKYPCLFYSWKGGCNAPNCQYAHTETNFKIFGDYLYSAKQSLDICVYTISSSILCNIILDVHQTGVLVRIIVDDESDNFTGSMIQKLRENGKNSFSCKSF